MSEHKPKIAMLGCGDFPLKDRINVDIRDLPGVDVVADVKKLPFKNRELDGIESRNLIEHFSRFEVEPLMKEWVRCLKKGGYIKTETVDMGRAMDNWRQIPTENFLDCMYGAQTYDENFHKMLMTQEILTQLYEDAGLKVTEAVGYIHREIPRMIITAVKL